MVFAPLYLRTLRRYTNAVIIIIIIIIIICQFICYNLVIIKFQEVLEDEKAALASHQTFQEAYNKCCVWIRTLTDRLASCTDGQSDWEKLQAHIDQIKVIFRLFFLEKCQ